MKIHGIEQIRLSVEYVKQHPSFYWVIGEEKPNSNKFHRLGFLNTHNAYYKPEAIQARHPGCKILYYYDKKNECEA